MIKDPPKKKTTGGRPSIDWDELHERWLTQVSYNTKEAFLASYGIDAQSKRVAARIKDWIEKVEAAEAKVSIIESDILTRHGEDDATFEQRIKNVTKMIRTWRAMQAESDYHAGNQLRTLVEGQIKLLQDRMDQGQDIKTYELVNLAKTLETIQRIQRLSLGMSTDNVGIEDARKLAEEQAGEEQQDDTPVFSVEVNENGKFTRLRPRRVK